MNGPQLIQQAIDAAQFVLETTPENNKKEMRLLINDLQEAEVTVFVRTTEARAMIENCASAAEALKEIVTTKGWGDEAVVVFARLERAIGKLRSTILVRTQRAT